MSNTRFASKQVPVDMLAAMAESQVVVTLCKAKRKSKNVKAKEQFAGSVLTINS